MSYIPITEATRRLARSDRQVRRMVHSGKLAYRYTPERRLEILASDVDKLTRRPLTAPELERLDAIERELIQLRERLDTLSKQVETLITPRERSPQKTIIRPITAPLAPGEDLPPGYTPIYDLIKQHGLTRQRQAIIRHMKPWLHEGHWKRAGHAVEKALDPQGQAEFLRRYVTQAEE